MRRVHCCYCYELGQPSVPGCCWLQQAARAEVAAAVVVGREGPRLQGCGAVLLVL